MKTIFLSHYFEDRDISNVLAKLIRRVTLKNIEVWFSSDNEPDGGMIPGKTWIEVIHKKLKESNVIIILLTPRSILRPWLYYESGFVASKDESLVIPVCVGISNHKDIPSPLNLFQSFLLSDYSSLVSFLSKLLRILDISFDEEMTKAIVEKSIHEISKLSEFQEQNENITPEKYFPYFEKKIDEIMNFQIKLAYGQSKSRSTSKNIAYNIKVFIDFPREKRRIDLEILPNYHCQRVLDKIFNSISDIMESFMYLEKWILRNVSTNRYLVLREIASDVPAECVFKPNSKWIAILLKEPYTSQMSKDVDRWY